MASTIASDLIEIHPDDAYPVVSHDPDVTPLSDADRIAHRPDCHLLLLDRSGTMVARCSCWWTRVPVTGAKPGLIGHYAAVDECSGATLLRHACARLLAGGCSNAVGPLDGNTWRSHRLVAESGTEPPFFLEPWTPTAWLGHWMAAGFTQVAEYTSAVNEDLTVEDPRVARAWARLEGAGIVIRPLNAADADGDLRRIFALSLESFSANYLYTPISEQEFLEQNRRLLSVVRPELVLLAEQQGEDRALRGLLFAIPDMLQTRRGVAIDTVVIKTVAVAPGLASAGLGSVLVSRAQRAARELGYARVIHALMHERNVSRNISRRYARTFRRYVLLGRPLRSS